MRLSERMKARREAQVNQRTSRDTQEAIKVNKELRDELRKNRQPGVASRGIRMLGRGFADIAKSLNSPSSNRRPKIAQMPDRRPDIATGPNRVNYNAMKMPGLRGRDIRGRREK